VAYSVNLVLTFPLTVYPANIIIESYVFKKMVGKSRTKDALINLSRILVSFIGVLTCALVGKGVDKFISVSGTLACTPISFMLPAIFHLKLAGPLSSTQTYIDYAIIAIAVVILIFCTGFTFWTWND
jgi:amino acid permease